MREQFEKKPSTIGSNPALKFRGENFLFNKQQEILSRMEENVGDARSRDTDSRTFETREMEERKRDDFAKYRARIDMNILFMPATHIEDSAIPDHLAVCWARTHLRGTPDTENFDQLDFYGWRVGKPEELPELAYVDRRGYRASNKEFIEASDDLILMVRDRDIHEYQMAQINRRNHNDFKERVPNLVKRYGQNANLEGFMYEDRLQNGHMGNVSHQTHYDVPQDGYSSYQPNYSPSPMQSYDSISRNSGIMATR